MPDAFTSENISKELWSKFSGAGPSFAVASLLQARAGRVEATEMGRCVVGAICEESAAICAAEGYPASAEIKKVLVEDLWGQKNSDYGPSILADIENGLPTEAQHVVGDLVRRGRQHNLHIPLLEASLCNIELYEAGFQPKQTHHHR